MQLVSKEMYPTLSLGRLRDELFPEGLVDLTMNLSIPESNIWNPLGFTQYLVYQSSLIKKLEVCIFV
jgi:hypothetical protein